MTAERFRGRLPLEWIRLKARLSAAVSRPPVAVIAADMCAGWILADCRFCEAICPLPGAVRFVAGRRGPFIDASICDGCGRCILACELEGSHGAIRLSSR